MNLSTQRFLLYFIILLPGIKDPLYQMTLLKELRVQQKQRMKTHIGKMKRENQNIAYKQKDHKVLRSVSWVQHNTYMCHEGVVDGGLWVTGPARLHCLPWRLGVGCCRLPIVVLEAWAGPLL